MQFKKRIRRVIGERELKMIERRIVIHSKELQENGTFLVEYTLYDMTKYENLVSQLVREKYPLNEEFAILRKAVRNPYISEYTEYNTYVEECKVQARAFIAERESVIKK